MNNTNLPPDFITSLIGLGVVIVLVCVVLIIGGLIERWVRGKLDYVPPPDPSTKRGAQRMDEQARYIRRLDRNR